MRRATLLFAIAAALLAPRAASAQTNPLNDTVPVLTAKAATITNSTTYGASRVFETTVLPALSDRDGFVAKVEMNELWNAVRLPTTYFFGEGDPRQYALAPVDLYSASIALGARLGHFGLPEGLGVFYVASVAYTDTLTIPTDRSSIMKRTASNIGVPLILAGHSIIAPFESYHGDPRDPKPLQTDYVAGVSYDFRVLNAYVGYVGTRGFFSNLSQENLKLIATAVITDELSKLPYLNVGLDRAPWEFLPNNAQRAIGLTSLTERKVDLTPANPDAFALSTVDVRNATSLSFWATHLDQLSISELVDIHVAVQEKPRIALQEARAGIHTPGFHLPNVSADKTSAWSGSGGSSPLGFGLTAGIVRLPDLFYMGVPGGYKWSLTAEARLQPFLRIAVQRNAPEILQVFPYAYDAWHLALSFGASSAELQALDARSGR